MAGMFDMVAGLLLAAGSFFYLVGAFGLVRMPEIFTRIHAASVMETLGAGLILLGMMVTAGWSLDTAKLVIILAILLYTGPVATHALARAALTAGVVPQLAEDRTARGRETSAVREIAAEEAKARRPRRARANRRRTKKGGGPSKR